MATLGTRRADAEAIDGREHSMRGHRRQRFDMDDKEAARSDDCGSVTVAQGPLRGWPPRGGGRRAGFEPVVGST